MALSSLAKFLVVGVLALEFCSCFAAPQIRNPGNGNPSNHLDNHIDDAASGNNIHGNNSAGRQGSWNNLGHGNSNSRMDNAQHLGHQMHLHWVEYVRNHARGPPPPIRHPASGPEPMWPQRRPPRAEWQQVWESEVENCGYPGTMSSLRELRVATVNEDENSFAKRGNYPWMVSLKWKQASHWCGGALISEQWVVTAVHCLFSMPPVFWGEKSWLVRLGVLNISAEHEETEQVFNVSRILVHPLFDKHMILSKDSPVGLPSDHDIALVKLSGRAKINPWVRPVCLPQPQELPPAGTHCVVTGWGWSAESQSLSDILKQGRLPIMDYTACKELDGYNELLTPNVLCAGFWEGGVDACKFDSGGPLQCRDGDQWVIVGVVSWGDKNGGLCAKPQRPGVYTRVDAHIDWIQESMYRDYAGIPLISWNEILPNPMLHPYR